MEILMIGGDKTFAHAINRDLEMEHYKIRYVRDGDLGLEIALKDHFDLIVLARSPLNKNGLSIVRELREQKNLTPILMLAADEPMRDLTLSIDSYDDTYVSKPKNVQDLIVQIKAIVLRIRRSQCSYSEFDIASVD